MNLNEMRFVLLGKSGVGKSRCGNSILGAPLFGFSASSNAVTQHCEKQEKYTFGKSIVVVDTPGIFAVNGLTEITKQEIQKCVLMSLPGPHIFFLCIQMGRITEEDVKCIDVLQQIFPNMLDFVVIIFTHNDRWIESMKDSGTLNPTEETYFNELPTVLQDFIQKNRYITVNNRLFDDAMREQQERILDVSKRVINENNGRHYSNATFEELKRNKQRKKILYLGAIILFTLLAAPKLPNFDCSHTVIVQ